VTNGITVNSLRMMSCRLCIVLEFYGRLVSREASEASGDSRAYNGIRTN